jgi:hypothetical protein
MGWEGMEWDGMGWDGMGWDGMGWIPMASHDMNLKSAHRYDMCIVSSSHLDIIHDIC